MRNFGGVEWMQHAGLLPAQAAATCQPAGRAGAEHPGIEEVATLAHQHQVAGMDRARAHPVMVTTRLDGSRGNRVSVRHIDRPATSLADGRGP
jgi:hypothetical protein